MLSCDTASVSAAVNRMISCGQLMLSEYCVPDAVALPEYYNAELAAAGKLLRLADTQPLVRLEGVEAEIERLEGKYGFEYDENQKAAIRRAVSGGVTVVTGGPGTGKTTVIRAVTDIFLSLKISFALTAPTGRAAKRMSETCGQEAKTIHRLLEERLLTSAERCASRATARTRSPTAPVIVDEMSMVDSLLFAALTDALRDGAYLIMIGDSDQLPPVGAGNVLSDIIESGKFDLTRLERIFRQASESLIVTNAHRINAGEMPVLDRKDADFFFLPCKSVSAARELIVSLCRDRLPAGYNADRETDIQVITPTRRGGLGTRELNATLQEALNPPAAGKSEKKSGRRDLPRRRQDNADPQQL